MRCAVVAWLFAEDGSLVERRVSTDHSDLRVKRHCHFAPGGAAVTCWRVCLFSLVWRVGVAFSLVWRVGVAFRIMLFGTAHVIEGVCVITTLMVLSIVLGI